MNKCYDRQRKLFTRRRHIRGPSGILCQSNCVADLSQDSDVEYSMWEVGCPILLLWVPHEHRLRNTKVVKDRRHSNSKLRLIPCDLEYEAFRNGGTVCRKTRYLRTCHNRSQQLSIVPGSNPLYWLNTYAHTYPKITELHGSTPLPFRVNRVGFFSRFGYK